jgi:hypothetical protein
MQTTRTKPIPSAAIKLAARRRIKLWPLCLNGITLLVVVNPLPAVLDARIDLPLQYTAAHLTRAFAYFLMIPVAGSGLE